MVHIRTVSVRFCYSYGSSKKYFQFVIIGLLLVAYHKYFFIILYTNYLNL